MSNITIHKFLQSLRRLGVSPSRQISRRTLRFPHRVIFLRLRPRFHHVFVESLARIHFRRRDARPAASRRRRYSGQTRSPPEVDAGGIHGSSRPARGKLSLGALRAFDAGVGFGARGLLLDENRRNEETILREKCQGRDGYGVDKTKNAYSVFDVFC